MPKKLISGIGYFQAVYVVVVVATMFASSFGVAQADPIDTLVNKASFVAGMVSLVVGFLMLLVIGIQVQAGAAVRSPAMIGGAMGGIFALIAGLVIVFFATDIFNLIVGTLNEAGRSTNLERFR